MNLRKGLGPCQTLVRVAGIVDPLFLEWGEWQSHDGSGLPRHLIGKRVWIGGLAHDGVSAHPAQDVVVTEEYASSAEAGVWDWSQGYGGVSGYRLRRHNRLDIGLDVVAALSEARRGRPISHLLLGMDGVDE